MKTLKSINPYNEKILSSYPIHTREEVFLKIKNANEAFSIWKKKPLDERLQLLLKLSILLKKEKKTLGSLATKEMGKPLAQSIAEVEKSALVCEYYQENAPKFLAPKSISTEAKRSYINYSPLGVILGVMPWNFPFWQVIRFAIPTLMAGNTVIFKHASNVSQCAKALENLFWEAGFPKDSFQNILIPSSEMEEIISHPYIQGVSLTGSSKAGEHIAKTAAPLMKKTVFELGGSDPYIILEDADQEVALKSCIQGRFLNAGQSCISAKRIIIHKSLFDTMENKMLTQVKKLTWGNPMEPHFDLGPLARKDIRDIVHQQVRESVELGAKLLAGGFIPEGKGFFYPPTLLSHVKEEMPAFKEEVFGPVMSLIKAESESHAIELANKSSFGLGSAIFTKNTKRAIEIAEYDLEVGSCFINNFVASNPKLPFGGIKKSGLGRELGPQGILEFTNCKTICLH